MHPIPVRTMKFGVPDAASFNPLCVAGNSALSYTHLATSLYAAAVEPFLVKSFRRVLDRIRDEALREEVDRFCRQEAQHYQRHADFNEAVYAHGYPGLRERVEALEADFERFLAVESDRFRIGFIEGFESYVTQFALQSLAGGLYDHRETERGIGDLFQWHMLEEVEHRTVAFDVYRHLSGGYLHRVRMVWVSQRHMVRFVSDCTRLMSRVDVARHGQRCRVSAKQYRRMAQARGAMRLRAMLPGYTPRQHALPPRIAELSAHFTRMAQGVR